MTTTQQEIKIILRADAGGTPAVFSRAQKDLRGVGDAAGYTRQQMQQVQFQLTDIASGLATGQSPLTVLLQQGGQLKDAFGGVGGALKALGAGIKEAFTVASVSGGALVLGIGAVVAGFVKGSEESAQFRRDILLTGNAAGQTAGGFDSMANRIAAAGNVTIGTARELAGGLVASGRVGAAAIETVGLAAARVQAVSGESAESIKADFATMGNGVADWAAEHNKAWHFINGEQLDYIRTLEDSGNAQKAMIVVGEALIEHLKGQQLQLGYLERGWKTIKGAASSAWDAMLGVGRDTTVEDRLEYINRRLADADRAARTSAGRNGLLGSGEYRGQLEGDRNTLLRDQLRQAEGASGRSADAFRVEQEIKLRGDLKRVTEELSGASSQYAKTIKTIQEASQQGLITEQQRVQMLTEAATKFGSKDQRKGEDPERAYRRMVEETLRNRAVSLAQIEAEGYEGANRAAEENMARTAEQLARRNRMAEDFGLQLEEQTAAINANLIADDQKRGLALIEIERETQQAKLDELAKGGADITAAQEALNRNIVARAAQLREQLKPEWQKMLEDWGDTTRGMRMMYDDLMGSLLNSTEDVVVRWATGQKATLADVGKELAAVFWRDTFRKDIAPTVAKGGQAVLEALGITRGSTSSSSGSVSESRVNQLLSDGGDGLSKLIGATDEQTNAADAASRAVALFGKGLDSVGSVFASAGSAVIQFVSGLAGGGGGDSGWLNGLMSLWSGSGSSGGSGGEGVTSGNNGLVDQGLGGGRALGGGVRGGMDYVVGENGPERLRMYRKGGGLVTPMSGDSVGGRGLTVVHQHSHTWMAGVTPAMLQAHGEALAQRVEAQTIESAYRPGRPLYRAARR
jgi:hypothetical protein